MFKIRDEYKQTFLILQLLRKLERFVFNFPYLQARLWNSDAQILIKEVWIGLT